MIEHFLALTPVEAIQTGEIKPKGDYLGTRGYIPGSVLRGALAEWLKAQDKASQILPIVQQIRFGNLFPSVSEAVWTLPFPMTAMECKLHSGFREVPLGDARNAGHGIRDSLLIALAYAELERSGARFPVPRLLRCTFRDKDGKPCGGRMERVGGFYAKLPEGWKKVSIPRAVQTKVALSRYRRASQEQMLYRVVALRPQGVFVGRVWTDDPDILDVLREAVQNMGVGALTTRGFGTASLRESDVRFPTIDKRLRTFNEKLREVWHDLAELTKQVGSSVSDEPEKTYFSVDLLSPAIFTDPSGIPTLKLRLQLNGTCLEPVWWATQPVFVGGFSTAWGMPKPTALGAAMGSVYVFRIEQTENEIIPALKNIETQGVGRRSDEGLGEILICHPFHEEVMLV